MILVAAMAFSAPAQARVAKSVADAKCAAGKDSDGEGSDWSGGLHPSAGGLTPVTIPGAMRISPREANCLFTAYEAKLIFLTPVNDTRLIPMTYRVPAGGAGGTLNDDVQAVVAKRLAAITKGDLDMPLVTYCHHQQCFLSYNLALRAAKAGYRNIYWLRTGLAGWHVAGGPTVPGDVESLAADRVRREVDAKKANALAQQKYERDEAERDRQTALDNSRRRSAPEAVLGREYQVTMANSYATQPAGTREFRHAFRIIGKRGDRFKISVRSSSGIAPHLDYRLERFIDGSKSEYVQSTETWTSDNTIFAPRKSTTFKLPADGAYYYTIEQIAYTGIGTSRLTNVDPKLYFVRIDRL